MANPNNRNFNAMVGEVFEPVESDGDSRAKAIPKTVAEWIDVPSEHALWRRHRRADQSQSGKSVNKKDENE